MEQHISFGLNHIACPYMDFRQLAAYAASCGIKAIEVRNDMPGSSDPFTGLTCEQARRAADNAGVRVCTLNAFGSFNHVHSLNARLEELGPLLRQLRAAGTEALILCPVNEPADMRSEEESFADTVQVLSSYGPLLLEHGIKGLIEPLGFSVSSLRTKRTAWEAVKASGCVEAYALVHDTFHHYLAGEQDYFPLETGLVHLSGVEDRIPVDEITDEHRVFITPADRTGAAEQVSELVRLGYRGIMSWEPFSSRIRQLDPEQLRKSLMESISGITQA